mgnify:CR=1 FL=1
MTNETFIIAEAGANHNRDKNLAFKLIDAAVNAKCNAVKFQTYSSNTLYSKNTPDFAGYKNINKLIKDIELPRNWQKDLKSYCDDNGIEFMSTPFDEKAVEELYNLGVKRFKVAGFEATDPRLVKIVAETQLPMIVSAGIGVTLERIGLITDWILQKNKKPDLTFLHCNNAYPTPFEDICLGQIQIIKNTKFNYKIKVGLSDHTLGIVVPPLAVTLGSQVVEKHFTLDRNLPGPDHPFAIEPTELSDMVKNIRIAEKCLSTKPELTSSEKRFTFAMRSVVSKKQINKGEAFSLDNITTKRPCLKNSVPAIDFFNLIGKTSSRLIKEDEIVFSNDIREGF